jgi:uncharacterized protein
VRAVFADTFYWVALISTEDTAHQRAMDLSRALAPDRIVTTDEMLLEYLAFFAAARPSVRAEAGKNVAELLKSVTVILACLELYWARPDKPLQPCGLHFHANDAARKVNRSADQ